MNIDQRSSCLHSPQLIGLLFLNFPAPDSVRIFSLCLLCHYLPNLTRLCAFVLSSMLDSSEPLRSGNHQPRSPSMENFKREHGKAGCQVLTKILKAAAWAQPLTHLAWQHKDILHTESAQVLLSSLGITDAIILAVSQVIRNGSR